MTSSLIASVVIPAYNRLPQLERAIESVKAQQAADQIEIIVIDDNSSPPLKPAGLRPQDKIIRNEANKGAAVSRNRGMDLARGEWICLLDSDDYFVDRDFSKLDTYEKNVVFYTGIKSSSYESHFPISIEEPNFFNYVLKDYPHIAQTSSLFFHRKLGLRFDERLPKHQDWDFILFQCLRKGISVRKAEGVTYFDRSDKASISRTSEYSKSDVWIDKLRLEGMNEDIIDWFSFMLKGPSKSDFTGPLFYANGFRFLLVKKINVVGFLKLIYKRSFR